MADLYNLEVDLLFFDTTSTHFQIEQADEPVPRDETGQRVEDETATRRAEVGVSDVGEVEGSP